MDPRSLRPPTRPRPVRQALLTTGLVLAAVLATGWWWARRERAANDATPPAPAAAPAPAATASSPEVAAASGAPVTVPPPTVLAVTAPPDAPLSAEQLPEALVSLLGTNAAQRLLLTEDFPRRLVATVDNLGREQASPLLWPARPTPGRFTVRTEGDHAVVDPDNGLRYAPFVLMAESVDARQVATLYRRAYPLLQQAYEDLGFPGRPFHARLLQVIDLLLATPEADGPLPVHLPAVAPGASAPLRPWVLYDFDDPRYAHLPAGQKLLLRTGAVNERRLKARLAALRAELAAQAPAAGPASGPVAR